MGYTSSELRIPLRLDNHGGEEQARDRQAVDALKEEIAELIRGNPDFEQIAVLGVEGGW